MFDDESNAFDDPPPSGGASGFAPGPSGAAPSPFAAGASAFFSASLMAPVPFLTFRTTLRLGRAPVCAVAGDSFLRSVKGAAEEDEGSPSRAPGIRRPRVDLNRPVTVRATAETAFPMTRVPLAASRRRAHGRCGSRGWKVSSHVFGRSSSRISRASRGWRLSAPWKRLLWL